MKVPRLTDAELVFFDEHGHGDCAQCDEGYPCDFLRVLTELRELRVDLKASRAGVDAAEATVNSLIVERRELREQNAALLAALTEVRDRQRDDNELSLSPELLLNYFRYTSAAALASVKRRRRVSEPVTDADLDELIEGAVFAELFEVSRAEAHLLLCELRELRAEKRELRKQNAALVAETERLRSALRHLKDLATSVVSAAESREAALANVKAGDA